MYNFIPLSDEIEEPEDVWNEGDDGARFYRFSGNRIYPSITTVLGYYKSLALQDWISNTNPVKRSGILTAASYRGNNFHDLVEYYIRQNSIFYGPEWVIMPNDKERLLAVMPYLKRINNIHCQETVLHSNKLKVAGRTDLIAEFDGILSVIDFKTSRKEKKEEYIQNYFEQETGYSIMYEELTGIKINQIVTIIAIDDDPEPQLFVKDKYLYVDSLIEKINNCPIKSEGKKE